MCVLKIDRDREQEKQRQTETDGKEGSVCKTLKGEGSELVIKSLS